jgi:hypothetical protein
MAKKRSSRSAPPPTAISADRFTRLHRLLRLLEAGPRPRALLLRRLRIDVRGFYRDLELLREASIEVTLTPQGYALTGSAAIAIALLPFPDPHLTYGDILQLARGQTQAARKLRQQVDRLV